MTENQWFDQSAGVTDAINQAVSASFAGPGFATAVGQQITNSYTTPGFTTAVSNAGTGVFAPINRSIRTETVSYQAVAADDVIVANGATVTITLPDPTTVSGKVITVKNINTAAATVATAGAGALIDAAATASLAQWAAGRYLSNGTGWLSI